MMQTLQLDVGDMIQVKTTSLELAQMVKLQPQDVNFLEISDPRAVLERVFRNFAALTKGDVFNFEYNDEIYEVAVLDVKPETEKMGVSMIETDVSVEFAPPVGYVEPERVPRAGSGVSTPRTPASGAGVPIGGLLHHQGTMAQAINYDAIAPGSALATAGNFAGEGYRVGKKGSAGKSGATPGTSTPKEAMPAAAAVPGKWNRNGPAPLRLPPNKLFLGYEIKPVKTKEDKENEAARGKGGYHFTGQGQTLRGAGKKKGGGEEKKGK